MSDGIQDDLGTSNGAAPSLDIQDELPAPDRGASDIRIKRWSPMRIGIASIFNVHWVGLAIAALWWSVTYFRTGPLLTAVAVVLSIAALGVIAGVAVSTFGISTRSWRTASRGKTGLILTIAVTTGLFAVLGAVLGNILGILAMPMALFTALYASATSSPPRPPRPFNASWSTGLIVVSSISITSWAYLTLSMLVIGRNFGESTNPLLQSLANLSIVMFAAVLVGIRLIWVGNTRTYRREALAGQAMLLAIAGILALRALLSVPGTARYVFLPVVALQIALLRWTTAQVDNRDAKAAQRVHRARSGRIVFPTVAGLHVAVAAAFALGWAASVFGDSRLHSEIAAVVAAAAVLVLVFLALPAVGLFAPTPNTPLHLPAVLPDTFVIVGLSFCAFSIITADGDAGADRAVLSLMLTGWATVIALMVRGVFDSAKPQPATVAVESPSGAGRDATSAARSPSKSTREGAWPSGLLFLTTLANVQWVYLLVAMTVISEGMNIGPIEPGSVVRRLATPVALGVLAGIALSWGATIRRRRSWALMGQWVLLAATVIVMVLLLFSGSAALSLAFVPLLVLQGVLVWWTAAQPESRELSTA